MGKVSKQKGASDFQSKRKENLKFLRDSGWKKDASGDWFTKPGFSHGFTLDGAIKAELKS